MKFPSDVIDENVELDGDWKPKHERVGSHTMFWIFWCALGIIFAVETILILCR